MNTELFKGAMRFLSGQHCSSVVYYSSFKIPICALQFPHLS